MTAKQSQLQIEVKTSQSVRKLTSDERCRETFRELRAMQMEWRAKAALEELEQCKKKEERDEQTHMQKESIGEAWKERRANKLKVDEESSFQCLTSEQKGQEQRRRKTLYNNWVGEPRTDSELHPDDFTHHSSTEKPSQQSREPKFQLQLQDKLKVRQWFEKFSLRKETRKLKTEVCYSNWTAYKESNQSSLSEQADSYRDSFSISRNGILKKSLC
ncbi:uncharacterized protein LOC104931133 isoform X2 [Larimichthys crocea]|uniref:uncharacterized protein LOC104931133 isoform X2 n=1 Tax=Larimichthys crocea TaxID=215358 RepID=UPI00054C688D|nr:uncharacterized protein LOC104931133 isoform X2 [Larimichthys crocea]